MMKKSAKIGVLISNLGTPDAPTKSAVRRYLKEFLWDSRVILPPPPRWFWWLILNLVILNIRPQKSAKNYQKIWGQFGTGSPLLDIAKTQTKLLAQKLNEGSAQKFIFALGMRYGKPSIYSAAEKLHDCEKIVILPLYPQYSKTTTESTFDAVAAALDKIAFAGRVLQIRDYHTDENYIKALVENIRVHRQKNENSLLLFSYHGIPERYYHQGDPYPDQCRATSKHLARALGLKKNQYLTTFQSRFGREQWMKPYTDETLKNLPARGIKNVQIVCPGFSADCLETLEEIGEENREYFLEAGGKFYEYIPALNISKMHIDCLANLIIKKINQESR